MHCRHSLVYRVGKDCRTSRWHERAQEQDGQKIRCSAVVIQSSEFVGRDEKFSLAFDPHSRDHTVEHARKPDKSIYHPLSTTATTMREGEKRVWCELHSASTKYTHSRDYVPNAGMYSKEKVHSETQRSVRSAVPVQEESATLAPKAEIKDKARTLESRGAC